MSRKKVTPDQRKLMRANIMGRLIRIVSDSKEIGTEMDQLPLRKGRTHLTLMGRGNYRGSHAYMDRDGRREIISATYKDSDGTWYEVEITNHGKMPTNPHYKLPFIKS